MSDVVETAPPKAPLSGPVALDTEIHGVRVYERITRLGEQRRYSPFANSWVAVYRGVDQGRNVLLLTARDADGDAFTVVNDVRDWEARGLVDVVRAGQGVATVGGFGGVRLRAIVEATAAHGATFPVEAALSIAVQSTRIARQMRNNGAQASDTFIGFDGAISILPVATHAARSVNEIPWAGDEIFDHLVVDGPEALRDLLTGEEPAPVYGMRPEGEQAPLPTGLPAALVRLVSTPLMPPLPAGQAAAPSGVPRTTSSALKAFEQGVLRVLEELGGVPPPSLLGSIARTLFPESFERQRTVDEELSLR